MSFKFIAVILLLAICGKVRPQGFDCNDNYLPDPERDDCAPGSPTDQWDCRMVRNCTWCPTTPNGAPWCYIPRFGLPPTTTTTVATTTTTAITSAGTTTTPGTGPTTTTPPPVGGNCGLLGHSGGSTIVIREALTTGSPIMTEFWRATAVNVLYTIVEPEPHNRYLYDARFGDIYWLATSAEFRHWQAEQGNERTVRRHVVFGCTGGGTTEYHFRIEMPS